MYECCEIFSFSQTFEDRQNCSMECLADDEADVCCYDECFAQISGIFQDEIFNKSAVLSSITRSESVGEAEIAVVKNSMKTCENLMIKSNPSETCDIPDRIFKFTQCVFIENYKNCPKVLENKSCQALGKVLDPCNPQTTTQKPTTKAKTKRKGTKNKTKKTTKKTK